MNTLIGSILGLMAAGVPAFAQTSQPFTDSLRIYYVGRPVGWERYTLAPGDGPTVTLKADLDYIDRGRRNHLQAAMTMGPDFAQRRVEVARLTDSTRVVTTQIEIGGRDALVIARGGSAVPLLVPEVTFVLSYMPVSQHLALVRFWKSHGRPATISGLPAGPTNQITVRRAGVDTVTLAGQRTVLTRYAIDGVVWGVEYAWLDSQDRLAMFASAAGGLSFKAVRAELVPAYPELMTIAANAAIRDLITMAARTRPMAAGHLALVGATLVDATGRPAIPNATVVVKDGRIVAAGPSAQTPVPAGARRIDVAGKTIVPGLWDMHAHLHQLEWVPVYLAAGVTGVRDMGNETPFITALRTSVASGRVAGPRLYAAGLVDGGGPNAFGALSATTPQEGREIVRQYHALGFEQMKLYSLLTPDVVAAICDEAHKLGMTVTGHIPRSLSLVAAIDSGMDQVAHMPNVGDIRTDSGKRVIAHLREKGIVVDPTASWGEIGGHSTAEPLANFQPVVQHLPPVFMQTRAAGWGSATVDTATAHARLARTLATIKALHDAGIPIVTGTDEGVPGFSVYREMELYVMAGLSPMDALRAATAVSAKGMGVDKDVGTIEPGKYADLLVLDANPLDNISNIRRLKLVMKGGALYDSAALWRGAGFTP